MLGSFKSGKFVLLARVGHFIPCAGIQKERDRKRSEQHVGDFLVLHPLGLRSPGAWATGTGCISKHAIMKRASSLGRARGCRLPEGHPGAIEVAPALPDTHTALSALPLSAPTRPASRGAGTADEGSAVSPNALACERPAGGAGAGVCSRQMALSDLAPEYARHTALGGPAEAWAQGGLGAGSRVARPIPAPPCHPRQCYRRTCWRARELTGRCDLTGTPEPFLICPHIAPASLPLLTHSCPARLPSLLLLV